MPRRLPHCTILGWIRDLGFPAKKLGGVWISDGHEIAEWRKAEPYDVEGEPDAVAAAGLTRLQVVTDLEPGR